MVVYMFIRVVDSGSQFAPLSAALVLESFAHALNIDQTLSETFAIISLLLHIVSRTCAYAAVSKAQRANHQ